MKVGPSLAVALSASAISVSVAAQETASQSVPLEQVIVSATRAGDGVRRDVLGASITVLETEDLQQRQTRIVSDVLRDVPGVSVSRSGTVGNLTQIRVRGTEGNHVLVLIDGMEASDPYYGEFDFATLLADDVAKIEVLRGQQSALYGSDAIGGVIHYITSTGKEHPGFSTRIEGGSFNTWEGAARFAGATETFDYAISGGYQSTDGVPTARFGKRDVGSENGVLSGKFQFSPTDNFRIRGVARYSSMDADTNDQDFSSPYGEFPYGYVVDSDDYYENRALYGLLRAELDSFEGRWRNALSVQGVSAERKGYSGSLLDYADEGSRFKASYESTVRFGSEAFSQTITGAVDFERERMQNTGPVYEPSMGLLRETENTGLVAQYDAVINERIGLGAAIRHDDNDRFQDADTYRLQASYRFDSGTRLRAAAGTGIKNPTVTELFGYDPTSFIGNPNLKPEKSEGWELGIEQSFASDAALVGLTYFDNSLENEIYTQYTPTFVSVPANRTTESTQKGVELFAVANVGEAWRFDVSYTHLDAKENEVEELRRPSDIGSLNINWQVVERASLNLTVRYNGETYDNNYTGVGPSRVLLSDYTLVNLGAEFQINERLGVYGRIENLLDEEYEEVYSYRTPGRAAYLGIRSAF